MTVPENLLKTLVVIGLLSMVAVACGGTGAGAEPTVTGNNSHPGCTRNKHAYGNTGNRCRPDRHTLSTDRCASRHHANTGAAARTTRVIHGSRT